MPPGPEPPAPSRLSSLFVFGGPARFALHGVTKIHPGTAPAGCGLAEGHINITMRVTCLG